MSILAKTDYSCILRYDGLDAVIGFWCEYSTLHEGKTPERVLNSEVSLRMKIYEKEGRNFIGSIEDVQRRIQGKMLNGKMLRSRTKEYIYSGQIENDCIDEFFVYQKGGRIITLIFSTTPKDREWAERYLKIIADSIE
jgi:hypothetical protein